MSRRAVVVTLDACGVGALPDAADYGDAGADTLAHVADAVGGFVLPTLGALGLGAVAPIAGLPDAAAHAPSAIHGRLAASGYGKDSTAGHWELMGAPLAAPMPTYPGGFPPDLVATLEEVTGARFCCNRPYDGIGAIEDFGAHHLATGELIVYTSQDSVMQIAAHADVLDVPGLRAACTAARTVMEGEHAVGRVIARPFAGEPGAFARVPGRRDYALSPPVRTALDALSEAGVAVHAVGKVDDLFASRGIAEAHKAADNAEGLSVTGELLRTLDAGSCSRTSSTPTRSTATARTSTASTPRCARSTPPSPAGWTSCARGDLLILTADHGVDPAMPHSDHTREHVPLLATGPGVAPHRHDGAMADVGATVRRWLTGRDDDALPGAPFA